MLEACAVLSTLKWRTRVDKIIGSRVIHLLNSPLDLRVFDDCDSDDSRVRTILSRIAAYTLAAGMKVIYCPVDAENNPAYPLSRLTWQEAEERHASWLPDQSQPSDENLEAWGSSFFPKLGPRPQEVNPLHVMD